jgi:hypothetical protein
MPSIRRAAFLLFALSCATAAAAPVHPTPAHPAPDDALPAFDMAKHCARATQGAWSYSKNQGTCEQSERAAYDALKASWASLDADTRIYCNKVAHDVDGSYATLADCIQTESQSDDYEAHLRAMAQHSSAFTAQGR